VFTPLPNRMVDLVFESFDITPLVRLRDLPLMFEIHRQWLVKIESGDRIDANIRKACRSCDLQAFFFFD